MNLIERLREMAETKRIKIFAGGINHVKSKPADLMEEAANTIEQLTKDKEWSTEIPTEPGQYWFYGYRYGKESCGRKQEPVFVYVEVRGVSGGKTMMVGEGQFMFKAEIEEAHFLPINLPEAPF